MPKLAGKGLKVFPTNLFVIKKEKLANVQERNWQTPLQAAEGRLFSMVDSDRARSHAKLRKICRKGCTNKAF